jgi:RNA polymerase sigma-70 factor (ECF subfamily)
VTLLAELGDDALAARAARGNAQAFAALVTRHKAPLYSYVRRYVGSADDAYDLLQQTFLSAWLALGRYDVKLSLVAWLRAIARNKCRDHARKTKVMRLLMIDDWSVPASRVADDRADPEETWIEEEGLRAIDAAIADLPHALKEPLLLTAFEGMSHIEAGRELGITAKAVETRISRARQKLASALNPSDGES